MFNKKILLCYSKVLKVNNSGGGVLNNSNSQEKKYLNFERYLNAIKNFAINIIAPLLWIFNPSMCLGIFANNFKIIVLNLM